jgi:transposase
MEISVLGIDLAKSVFQLHGVDLKGKNVLRKRLSRGQLLAFVANLPNCLIGMEACGGAHYWARELRKLGHRVKLISPQFVKPYVKSNKNDAADAEAICEAVTRPHMRFVSIKEVDQQDLQNLHRVRERLVKARTALSNEIRGLLHEYGIVLPQKMGQLRKGLPVALSQSEDRLSALSQEVFRNLQKELQDLDEKISFYDYKIHAVHESHPVCQRLAEIPGVGPLSSTALVAAIGNPQAFKNGRELSAWLGLVPKQHSSGGKDQLLGISKRGDVYLRKLLIHGARATLRWARLKSDARSQWINRLVERRGANRAAVALANKNARIVWVLMARQERYQDPGSLRLGSIRAAKA